MTRDEIGTVLRTRFRTLVSDVLGLPVQYDNLPFSRPASGPYLRHTSIEIRSFTAEIGSTLRVIGLQVVHVLSPVAEGEGNSLDIVDAVDVAFRSVNDTDLELQQSIISPGLERDGFWRVAISTPWVADARI